ncbi:MAG: hypothetical protein ACR2RL_22480 [Gammaproteobacteria bacterium]
MASVGSPVAAHVAYGEKIHRSLPAQVLDALHNPRTAAWVVYAVLLMHDDDEQRERYAPAADELLRRAEGLACADAVLHDGEVTIAEGELLRAVAECLDCPMPPLVAG